MTDYFSQAYFINDDTVYCKDCAPPASIVNGPGVGVTCATCRAHTYEAHDGPFGIKWNRPTAIDVFKESVNE